LDLWGKAGFKPLFPEPFTKLTVGSSKEDVRDNAHARQEGEEYAMKTILCYGDSNTWGFNPHTGGRYDHKTRWPMALEGLNGRTSCREDMVEGDRNGLRQILPILESHRPLDMAAVML
jgi:lysophospholipase L1-like esterase